MTNAPTYIQCANLECQAPNLEGSHFCEKCRTPLPKRYLWAIGRPSEIGKAGQLFDNRYMSKGKGILLDTRPGLLPRLSDEPPPEIEPYLRLFTHRLNVPQAYGYLQLPTEQGAAKKFWLLEAGAIDVGDGVKPLPYLTALWKEAPAFRQLHWLWQIAKLWEPFEQQGVTATLLDVECLRAAGSLVRVLELKKTTTPASIKALGQLWKGWTREAQPEVAPFLKELTQMMQQGTVVAADQVVALLDRGLHALKPKMSAHDLTLATRTDCGPTRKRNEDACYPESGTIATLDTESTAIVCDGIGGHAGGDVASKEAIRVIRQTLAGLPEPSAAPDRDRVEDTLLEAVCAANDAISTSNDEQQKQGRQRMGTTLVMALARGCQIYTAHVGDSRAYLIAPHGCYQITVDDDVASREVRLGYAAYRDALQHMGSGSLVQALGMHPSIALHPTVQRFVLDEECIFLLCSDGLSDRDRVEQFWRAEILPILIGKA